MKIGGCCASMPRTCIGEVWVRSSTSRGPGGTLSGSPSAPYSATPLGERLGIDVEGVLEHPRGMPGRVVEGGEVVVVVLDLGALHDPVAEARRRRPRSRAGSASAGAGGRPRRAASPAASRRSRSVGQPRLELAGLELATARFELSASIALRGPRCRPCRPAPRSAGSSSPIPRRIVGQLRLAAEVADPQLLELGGRTGGGDRRLGLGADLGDPLDHCSSLARVRGQSAAADDIRCRRDGRTRRDVQRLGARSQGDRSGRLAGGERPRRRPRRARPRARGSPGPERRARRRGRGPRGRPAPSRGAGVAATGRARRTGEHGAHARPHGLRRVRVGAAGAEHHARRRTSAAALRTIVPTLPGSATPSRKTQGPLSGTGRIRQVPDGDHPRPRAERRAPRRAAPARPRSPAGAGSAPGGARSEHDRGFRPAVEPRLEQVLALGHEQPSRARPRPSCQAGGPASASRSSGLVITLSSVLVWLRFSASGNKKGGRIAVRPGESPMRPRLRRGLPGHLGKSAERLGIAHGDVGQHLAVDLDAGFA